MEQSHAEENLPHLSHQNQQNHNETNLFHNHLKRQALVLSNIIEDKENIDIFQLAAELEKAIFEPKERKTNGDPDPKLNFFPPFLIPESLALHFPFFINTAIPKSCKINRIGTDSYRAWKEQKVLPEIDFDFEGKWDDSLGNVDTIAELRENQKLAFLKSDYHRLTWVKSKALNLTSFSYPCLSLPPPLYRTLLETFIGKIQQPEDITSSYTDALTETVLQQYFPDVNPIEIRKNIVHTVQHVLILHCMQKFFNRPTIIKNIQECLHYALCHGFVRLIELLTNCNLSEFVTYHGLTHRNRLNNPFVHLQLANEDRFDYLIDTIYLLLIYTWQTAMDIWQHALDKATLNSLQKRLKESFPVIFESYKVNHLSQTLSNIVFPDLLLTALETNLPDFTNQAQIQNYRNFICLKSNIPQSICPILPSDLVPLTYKESAPVLWPHVYLLNIAAFLLNHGDYMKDIETPTIVSTCLCDCNLCAPHRMPCYNPSLMQEILTVGKFEFQGPPDTNNQPSKSIKLTPQIFANAYLQHFKKEDFYYNKVLLYTSDQDKFTSNLEACVIKNFKLLATLRETQIRREKELLKRGSGIYLDPQTGEPLAVPLEQGEENNYDRRRKTVLPNGSLPSSSARETEEFALSTTDDEKFSNGSRGFEQQRRRYRRRRSSEWGGVRGADRDSTF